MTNNQQQIINSLISEFDKINQSKRNDNDLLSFIQNELDAVSQKAKEFAEQTRIANIINDEIADSIEQKITDLISNFGYTLKVYRHPRYYEWTITFVGEVDNRYGNWERKAWYGEKHLASYNNKDGLEKGGLRLTSSFNSCAEFSNDDSLLKNIANHIIYLKKRSI